VHHRPNLVSVRIMCAGEVREETTNALLNGGNRRLQPHARPRSRELMAGDLDEVEVPSLAEQRARRKLRRALPADVRPRPMRGAA
jgi:hypothetical protein